MTFSILGFCPEHDQVGIGYTTVTLAGGGTSPFYSYAGDIVVVQAYGNQHTAIAGARALDAGLSMADVSAAMQAADANFDFRQVGIMRRSGESFVRTGPKARPWAGHIQGPDFVAMGNVLVGEQVVRAMAEAFEAGRGTHPLAVRLLQAIEAGRDAGGQLAPGNQHYDERSALLRVIGDGPERRDMTVLDLRVDMASQAVQELRRMYEIYQPVVKRRSLRASDPGQDLPTAVWEAEHLRDNPPPPAIR